MSQSRERGALSLRISDNRGYAMSVEYPDGWTASVSSADEVDEAIASWVSQKVSSAPRDRSIAVVPPGQTITLTVNGEQNPLVRVTADGEAYLASGFLYGVDTLAMVMGRIPGTKTPKPSALARAVKSLDNSTQCIRQGIDLVRTDPSTGRGVADLFGKDFKLAIGCLQDLWEVAYGANAGVAAFFAGVVDWLVTGAGTVVQGAVASIDSIRYFGGVRFSVVSSTRSGALTFGSWREATVGMSEGQVQSAVGPLPVGQVGSCHRLGRTTASGTAAGPLYTIDGSTGRLIGIQPSDSEKADRGIGVGATVAQVRKAYPQLSWALGDEGLVFVGVAVDSAHADRALGFQFTGSTNEGASGDAQSPPPNDRETLTSILAGTTDFVSLFEVCSG